MCTDSRAALSMQPFLDFCGATELMGKSYNFSSKLCLVTMVSMGSSKCIVLHVRKTITFPCCVHVTRAPCFSAWPDFNRRM